MHVGHVQECAKGFRGLPVERACNGSPGNGPRHFILGEGAGIVTVEISGKLVEDKHQGESALGFVSPILMRTADDRTVKRAEMRANLGVKSGAVGPPFAGPRRCPK